jgi:hypothetical protein
MPNETRAAASHHSPNTRQQRTRPLLTQAAAMQDGQLARARLYYMLQHTAVGRDLLAVLGWHKRHGTCLIGLGLGLGARRPPSALHCDGQSRDLRVLRGW